MKKGPLSKKEREYIETHSKTSVASLCKKLDRSESLIRTHLAVISQREPSDMFTRKKERGVVVMTEAQSNKFDEARSNETREMPDKIKQSIHKIKED
jgi:hypothetical protein